jgi:mono/diheme cytochrome c family protein
MMKMMKKVGRWVGYALLVLLIAGIAFYGYAYRRGEGKLNQMYPAPLPAIHIPDDSASIARGGRLYMVHGCYDCHKPDLSGQPILDNPLVGYIAARNLTKGQGGLPAEYSDADWLRALKHGVNREGKPFVVMPANESSKLPDRDLADIIAYCKSRPPVDNPALKQLTLGPLGRIMLAFGQFPADKIDHAPRPIAEKKPEVSAAYGEYLTINCTGCHRSNFQGGPPLVPGKPPVPDITRRGRVGKWTEAEFLRTLRTGITPEGHRLDSTLMPWRRTSKFTDTELRAVRAFLVSLPAGS